MPDSLNIVVLGLSITSSWGNGHATTYRGLLREFARRGHRVLFLERNVPWYDAHRDLPAPEFCRLGLYESLDQLRSDYEDAVRNADAVMVGSYVPEGVEVGMWVTEKAQGITAFYDIDTPVTLAKLLRGDEEYLDCRLVSRYDLYLSFTGGPTLRALEREFGSPKAMPLYCSFDPDIYYPEEVERHYDLGYMGTYSDDRQPIVEELLIAPANAWSAGRFIVVGPQYPLSIGWPVNVARTEHLPPDRHRAFYNSQRFTLNVTRQDMIRAGYSPSVRLFEAAACGTPVISDYWDGLDSVLEIGREIWVAESRRDVLEILLETTEDERLLRARKARTRVLAEHTAAHRAEQLENYLLNELEQRACLFAGQSNLKNMEL